MPTVDLNLPHHRYQIHIESGLIGRLGAMVRAVAPHGKAGIILDQAIEETHGRTAARSLQAAGFDTTVAVMAATEKKKSLGTVRELLGVFLDAKLERRSPIVTVGGGIVGDTGGFVAATYLRGVPFVQCPTTLLAMVDASVGGKVGVNVPQGKNLVGAFHQPSLVLIDVDVLASLPDRDFKCGLAECIKHGVICDEPLFDWIGANAAKILARDVPTLIELVERNVRIKARVVEADEKEAGIRAHLNFGHTFAHAIEATGAFKAQKHGEAVALGMVAATGLAMERGRVEKGVLRRLIDTLEAVGLPTHTPRLAPTRKLMEAMRLDKKVADGRIRLILPDRIGAVSIVSDTPDEAIEAAWAGIGD